MSYITAPNVQIIQGAADIDILSATLTDDTVFDVAIEPGNYLIDYYWAFSRASGTDCGLKWDWDVNGNVRIMTWGASGGGTSGDSTATAFVQSTDTADNVTGTTVFGGKYTFAGRGWVNCVSADNITLRHSQNAANTTILTRLAESWMRIEKVI